MGCMIDIMIHVMIDADLDIQVDAASDPLMDAARLSLRGAICEANASGMWLRCDLFGFSHFE